MHPCNSISINVLGWMDDLQPSAQVSASVV